MCQCVTYSYIWPIDALQLTTYPMVPSQSLGGPRNLPWTLRPCWSWAIPCSDWCHPTIRTSGDQGLIWVPNSSRWCSFFGIIPRTCWFQICDFIKSQFAQTTNFWAIFGILNHETWGFTHQHWGLYADFNGRLHPKWLYSSGPSPVISHLRPHGNGKPNFITRKIMGFDRFFLQLAMVKACGVWRVAHQVPGGHCHYQK